MVAELSAPGVIFEPWTLEPADLHGVERDVSGSGSPVPGLQETEPDGADLTEVETCRTRRLRVEFGLPGVSHWPAAAQA